VVKQVKAGVAQRCDSSLNNTTTTATTTAADATPVSVEAHTGAVRGYCKAVVMVRPLCERAEERRGERGARSATLYTVLRTAI